MKDYRVTVKVQNNYMFTAMKSMGIDTASELGRIANVSPSRIGEYLNLKLTPFMKNGEYRPDIVRISVVLNTMITDLFPEENLYLALETNKSSFEMNSHEISALITDNSTQDLLEKEATIDAIGFILNSLTKREQKVIRMRYGIDCKQMTLEEVAKEFDVSRERIRQMEQKALRKCRHPKRVAIIKLNNRAKEEFDPEQCIGRKSLNEHINEN